MGVYDASLDEIEERFVTDDRRRSMMARLREAVGALRTTGYVVQIFVDGCFIGPRADTKDVDVLATIAKLPRDRRVAAEARRISMRDLRKAFNPTVEVLYYDEGAPEVAGLLDVFQEDKAAHGGHKKGIVRLVE